MLVYINILSNIESMVKHAFNKKLLDLVKNYDMDIVDFGHAIPADESGLK